MKIDAATGETLHFCKLLFFWLLNILIDPIHHKAKARVLPILSHLLTIVMTSGWNVSDMRLQKMYSLTGLSRPIESFHWNSFTSMALLLRPLKVLY